jgi:hypothetical protein
MIRATASRPVTGSSEQEVHDRAAAVAAQPDRGQAMLGRLLQGRHDLVAMLADAKDVAGRLVIAGDRDGEVQVPCEARLCSDRDRDATHHRAGDVGRRAVSAARIEDRAVIAPVARCKPCESFGQWSA